jgi:pyrimidine operon attenuation protein / uracil phosphoribosyltransferase
MQGGVGRQRTTELMDGGRLSKTLAGLARELLGRHPRMAGTVFIGIRSRGVPLARRLARLVKEHGGMEPRVGALDITLYRDDLTRIAPNPVMKGTDIPFSIDGETVVLVDDVLYTGRTVRAALDELIDFGRPARIELAVLVDRGHRELPINADYVGMTLATSPEANVQVMVREEDGEDRVLLFDKQPRREPPRGRSAAAKRRPASRRRESA